MAVWWISVSGFGLSRSSCAVKQWHNSHLEDRRVQNVQHLYHQSTILLTSFCTSDFLSNRMLSRIRSVPPPTVWISPYWNWRCWAREIISACVGCKCVSGCSNVCALFGFPTVSWLRRTRLEFIHVEGGRYLCRLTALGQTLFHGKMLNATGYW